MITHIYDITGRDIKRPVERQATRAAICPRELSSALFSAINFVKPFPIERTPAGVGESPRDICTMM